MDQCEDTQEGAPPSKSTLCGEDESQSKAQRNQPGPGYEPSWVSFRKKNPPDLKTNGVEQIHQRLSNGSEARSASFKNHQSNGHPSHFKSVASSWQERIGQKLRNGSIFKPSCVSFRSDQSNGYPSLFKSAVSSSERGDHCESILSEENEEENRGKTCFSFTPEVNPDKDGVLYSFRFSGSGLFQCSLTGLKFHVIQDTEVNYRTSIWDATLLESRQLQAKGPLFSIESPQGSVSQLHLPHCEPEPSSESLSVLHINDDTSLIQPVEITETHVVVNVPHLCAFGIVTFCQKLKKKKIKGQALLFWDCINNFISIHVILLPRNVPLRDVKEFHKDSEYIKIPPYCDFYKDRTYSCHSDPAWFEIQPTRSEVSENFGPNYHALFCLRLPLTSENRTKDVTVTIKDQRGRVIWQYKLSPQEMMERKQSVPNGSFNTERMMLIRPDFIDKVSDPTLDKLLLNLRQCQAITSSEEEHVREQNPKSQKARKLFDIVTKKGEKACSDLIQILKEEDQALSENLSLMRGTD